MAFEKIGKVGKIRKVAKLSVGRRISTERIAVRARTPGTEEDPLEKAAMQGVVGTLPERIVWKWLEDEDRLYTAQQAEMGGRWALGGATVDFVLYDEGDRPVVLRVQGDYWHGPQFPKRQARDDEQAARLRAQGYAVVDLWEGDIYEAAVGDRLGRYIEGEISGAI